MVQYSNNIRIGWSVYGNIRINKNNFKHRVIKLTLCNHNFNVNKKVSFSRSFNDGDIADFGNY